MFDPKVIPNTAHLFKEEDGVKWYVEGKNVNYMMFEERVLIGSWAAPGCIFRVLTWMPPEERTRYRTHDECMAAINTRLASDRGER